MIPDLDEGGFLPGAIAPVHLPEVELLPDVASAYLEAGDWKRGMGVLLLGPPGCGKTALGLTILHAIHKSEPSTGMEYWTEAEFISDLKVLWSYEEMTQKLPRDDALWKEARDWERLFWALKDTQYLFLDDVSRSYTPMQWYETENMLRTRYNQNRPTMVAVSNSRWENTSEEVQSLIERNKVKLVMGPR